MGSEQSLAETRGLPWNMTMSLDPHVLGTRWDIRISFVFQVWISCGQLWIVSLQ